MKIPIALYGLTKEVTSSCRKAITAFRRGGAWLEVFGETIDSHRVPGVLAVDGPSPLLGGAAHFHMYRPRWELDRAIREGRIPPAQVDVMFAAALTEPWGLLTLMSELSYDVFAERPQRRVFVEAVARVWDVLDAEGTRYSKGSNTGLSLWRVPTTLKYALANEGVSTEVLLAPLPPGGLPALLEALEWSSHESGLKRLN